LLVQAMKRVVERVRGPQPGGAYQDAEAVNAAALAWIDARPEGHPFVLFAAYMDPHDPYFAHPYDGSPGYARSTHPSPAATEAPHLLDLYDGEIVYWDAKLGELIAALRERGLYDESTIVITSDHGEEFAEHGGFWHGTTLYDEQVRVPLFVKLPFNRRGGQVVHHWVQSIDLLPTLARENGLPAIEGVQGGHLDHGTDRVYAEENHEGNVLQSLRARRGQSELKVITANAGNPRGLPEVELFRVDQDPGERVNLVDAQPRVVEIVSQRLSTAADDAGRGAVERQQTSGEANDARLRSLGYVGDGDER
jgi:arylsulfatase A-like enzyme